MSNPALLPRPPWHSRTNVIRRKPYWIQYRYGNSLLVHMVPFDRVCEFDRFLQPSTTDYGQWGIVLEQEFKAYEALVNPSKNKNLYTPKPKPEQETGGSSGKGFGPRH